MGEVAAIGSLMSGAAGLGSALFANNNAAEIQAQIANNNLTMAQNQQRYQAGLSAEAMRRAIAGTIDAQGNRISYDPATNTWRTELSPRGASMQNAIDNANMQRNTTEFQRQLRANAGAETRAAAVEPAADAMRRQIERFQPTDTRALEGDLQNATSLASRETFRPLVDSTLRAFARSGTTAGPALANIGNTAYTALRRAMLDNVIKAKMSGTELDNSKRGGMINDFTKLNAQSTPSFNYAPIGGEGPGSALANAIAQRANGSSTAASYAAMGAPGMTNALTAASNAAIGTVPNSNLFSAQLRALGGALQPSNLNPMIAAIQSLTSGGGAGNAGDNSGGQWTILPNTGWQAPVYDGRWD